MPWRLVQTRACDGACCDESPRFPTQSGGCKYLGTDRACKLMAQAVGDKGTLADFDFSRLTLPQKDSASDVVPIKTNIELFRDTCVNWPQNIPEEQKRADKTGACCWQFEWAD